MRKPCERMIGRPSPPVSSKRIRWPLTSAKGMTGTLLGSRCAATLHGRAITHVAADLHEIFTPRTGFCTPSARRRFADPRYGQMLSHSRAGDGGVVIGWVILVAVLVPALALGRWAEHERRRAQPRVRAGSEPGVALG